MLQAPRGVKWKEVNAMYELVYFSGAVVFFAACWTYVRIRAGGRR